LFRLAPDIGGLKFDKDVRKEMRILKRCLKGLIISDK